MCKNMAQPDRATYDNMVHVLYLPDNYGYGHTHTQNLEVKVKQSRYRPGVAQRVPGS
jgi:hypothetical protein